MSTSLKWKPGVLTWTAREFPALAFIIFSTVMSLGSDFALTDVFPHGFSSFVALDTLFCPSQFLCPPQILNLLLPRDVLVLLSVPCHFPKPQPVSSSCRLFPPCHTISPTSRCLPGIKPKSPAWTDRLITTEPPGQP